MVYKTNMASRFVNRGVSDLNDMFKTGNRNGDHRVSRGGSQAVLVGNSVHLDPNMTNQDG